MSEELQKGSWFCIYYDTGNVEDGLSALHGLLYAINEVANVESVVINEI